MPYIATRAKTIAGRPYQRGELVDTTSLPLPKLATLVRVGYIVQADRADEMAVQPIISSAPEPVIEAPEPVIEVEATEEVGELCPTCGAGPFTNLRLHISRMHESLDDDDEEEG